VGRWEPDARGRLEQAALELFEEGIGQVPLKLVESKTFGTGVLYRTYQPPQS